MPAMRAQASAVYVGVITIVASVGPVLVSGWHSVHGIIYNTMASGSACTQHTCTSALMCRM